MRPTICVGAALILTCSAVPLSNSKPKQAILERRFWPFTSSKSAHSKQLEREMSQETMVKNFIQSNTVSRYQKEVRYQLDFEAFEFERFKKAGGATLEAFNDANGFVQKVNKAKSVIYFVQILYALMSMTH